jgi:uncharacterized repeat protein (TIGR03843 family)
MGPTDAVALLRHGALEVEGRLVDASNTTLRAIITLDGVQARCVYKPVRGERPLWDFPDGTLAGREVAAYLLAAATGWDCVPPTVLREGPLGPGACQLWIDEPEQCELLVGFVPADEVPLGWHGILAAQDTDGTPYVLAHADDSRLARLAVFDVIANNADRKGGHILVTADGQVYGVDHGVCFNTANKLRTVLWGWTAEKLPGEADAVLGELAGQLAGELGEQLSGHLTAGEMTTLRRRVNRLRSTGRFPEPGQGWPAVPWPPM